MFYLTYSFTHSFTLSFIHSFTHRRVQGVARPKLRRRQQSPLAPTPSGALPMAFPGANDDDDDDDDDDDENDNNASAVAVNEDGTVNSELAWFCYIVCCLLRYDCRCVVVVVVVVFSSQYFSLSLS